MTTVVFADLVGSTGLFERLGDESGGRFVTQLTADLSKTFERHHGRVVKLLGDGLFVVFPHEGQALMACIAVQKRMVEQPFIPEGDSLPVKMQLGIESGEVVEIDGDCFGDAVNTAARLADLAGADQILTTARVHAAVVPALRSQLRTLGPMYLRGKSEATEVFQVDWRHEHDSDATVMGVSMFANLGREVLELSWGGQMQRLGARGEKISLGRSATSAIPFTDSRVSRQHASVEWRGGQFILADGSSYGTWVYMGDQPEPLALRRTECWLVGRGQIVLGCERDVAGATVIDFVVSR